MVRPPIKRKGKAVASVTQSSFLSTKEIKENFTKLGNRNIVATRFFDHSTLSELGLLDSIARVMDKIGLKGLLDLGAYTYKNWTLEFIASLVVLKPNDSEEGKIFFRLAGTNHTMTFSELREAFGISNPPSHDFKFVNSEECQNVWQAITHLKFDSNSLNTQIPHPVLRLVTRFLVMAFQGHGESRKISKVGVTFLKTMTSIDSGTPDWVDIFVDSCITKQKATAGAISLGGMITILGQRLELQPPVEECVGTEYKFDVKCLEKFAMFTRSDKGEATKGCWNLGPNTTKYLVLPRGENSTPLPEGDRPVDWYIAGGEAHEDVRGFAGGEAIEKDTRTVVDASVPSSSTRQEHDPIVDQNRDWFSRIESLLLAQSEQLKAMENRQTSLEAKLDQQNTVNNERWIMLERYAKQNLMFNMVIQKDLCVKSKRKLIVLDFNGLLVDVVDKPFAIQPQFVLKNKGVHKRPNVDAFLDICFHHFDVGLWTSRTRQNLEPMLDALFPNCTDLWRFIWDQSQCTKTEFSVPGKPKKPLMLKELKKIWMNRRNEYSWKEGFYDSSNTLLLDDSPYKALKNPPNTAIFPLPYDHTNREDNELANIAGGLLNYLQGILVADNVQSYVEHHHYGQHAISSASPDWDFYKKIIGESI